ncbi:MAG: hypothetical protein IKJ99_05560 [Oscillospiraceae bacterium]|nr:hypothetical protein [Oscillospiraceae bacterium]
MSGCANCSGGCGGCSGCGSAMELSRGEIQMILKLGQIPFLPVARKAGDDIPVYLEDDDYTPEEYSLILQCLEKRGLIDIDYWQPLKSFNDSAYSAYPLRGSFALTARGQQVLELLEIQGAE